MRKRAYTFSQKAVWCQVAAEYMALFHEVKVERTNKALIIFETKTLDQDKTSLPEINLKNLLSMTDDTGIIQHATFTMPNYDHGYCVDNNASALIVSVMVHGLMSEELEIISLQKKYLAFTKHAFNEENGKFRNFMAYDRNWRTFFLIN